MTETTGWQLIKRHVQRHTEADAQAAFGTLARRHMDMVYGTCLRALGEPVLAEDAAQAVFLVLARKAPAFRPGTTLPSWLFQTALLTVSNVRRFATCTENGAFADRYARVPLSHSGRDQLWAFGGLIGQGHAGDRGMPGVAVGQRVSAYGNTKSPEYSLGKPLLFDAPGVRARMVDVVTVRLPYLPGWKGSGEVVTFCIGQSDHLLCMLTDAEPVSPTAWSTRTETYSSIQVNPKLPASDFVFTPPPSSHEVHNTSELFPIGGG